MSIGGTERSIMADTQDPLSAMLRIKEIDFQKQPEFEININTNQKNYLLRGRAIPKELIIDGKKYKLFFLNAEIKRRDKNPYHKTNISIVMLKEKENIPILIKVFASGILINAKLVDTR